MNQYKTYSSNQLGSQLRSFYMSPSSSPKITVDAVHLLVGLEMNKTKQGYQPQRFKLIDMPGVKTNFKAEINTSNPKLHKSSHLLATGNFGVYKLEV